MTVVINSLEVKRSNFYGEEDTWIGSPYLKLVGDLAAAFQQYLDDSLGHKRYTVVLSRLENTVGIVDERDAEVIWTQEFDPVRLTRYTPEQAYETYLPYLKEAVRRLQERGE